MVSYQTTIRGNALGMAKAGKPVTRASAEEVLRNQLSDFLQLRFLPLW
jgi:hypothetical protein